MGNGVNSGPYLRPDMFEILLKRKSSIHMWDQVSHVSYELSVGLIDVRIGVWYLGVTIDSKLSWNSHIDTVTKRANKTTAFLRRNLSSCPKDVKAKCYKSIIRPQLEYASTVWDPVIKSKIAKLVSVQRRAARFCCNDYRRTSSVT